MVAKQLRTLLFNHDCVVLPGFGGIISNPAISEIHPVTNAFMPPRKRLAFNASLQSNDGLLVNELSINQGISRSESVAIVDDFVKEILAQLEEQKQYIIEGVGKFFYNKEHKVQFEPDNKENYLDESFGLPELHFKPILREEEDMNRPHPAQSRQAVRRAPVKRKPESEKGDGSKETKEGEEKKGVSKVFIIIPAVLLLLASAAVSLYFVDDGKYQSYLGISSSSHEAVEGDENIDAAAIDADIHGEHSEDHSGDHHDEFDEHHTSSDDSHAISDSGHRYHVIGGVFSKRSYAKRLANKRSGEVIEVDGLYKVSIANFSSKADADHEIASLRSQYGNDLWIMSH